jgi:hypothetical protein
VPADVSQTRLRAEVAAVLADEDSHPSDQEGRPSRPVISATRHLLVQVLEKPSVA